MKASLNDYSAEYDERRQRLELDHRRQLEDLEEIHYYGYHDEGLDLIRQIESERFQKHVDALLADDVLTKSEAISLVKSHNQMQASARTVLLKLLRKYGQESVIDQAEFRSTPTKSIVLRNNGKWVDAGVTARKPFPPRPEPNVVTDMEDTFKEIGVVNFGVLIPSGKKTRFALIVGPAIVAILLRLFGVI